MPRHLLTFGEMADILLKALEEANKLEEAGKAAGAKPGGGVPERLLTPRDVAEALSIPVDTARRFMRERMVHMRIGKHIRVTPQALAAYKAKVEVRPPGEPHPMMSARDPDEPPIRPTQPRPRRRKGEVPAAPSASSDDLPIRPTQPKLRRKALR